MRALNKTVTLEIISCLIVGGLGAGLAFTYIPFPISAPIPWLLGAIFSLPIMLSVQFITNLNNTSTDLRSDLNTTEIARYQTSVAPIKTLLYCYFWWFLVSGVFVGWACYSAQASYAPLTLSLAVGLTCIGVRFLIVLLKRNEQLATIKDRIKADSEHRKRLGTLETEMQ